MPKPSMSESEREFALELAEIWTDARIADELTRIRYENGDKRKVTSAMIRRLRRTNCVIKRPDNTIDYKASKRHKEKKRR